MATYRNHELPAELEQCTFQNRVGEKMVCHKETPVTDLGVIRNTSDWLACHKETPVSDKTLVFLYSHAAEVAYHGSKENPSQ
jgi:hypothetical protein